MDDRSFDRLARVVSGLRSGATRRGALKALLGGALAIPALAAADDGEAKKKNKKRKSRKARNRWWDNDWGCRANWQYCTRNAQCCSGACRNNICGYYDPGYPGGTCKNTNCPDGWSCRKVANGVHVCMPNGSSSCCNGACWPDGYRCCKGGACGPGMSCCGNGTCCTSGLKCCGSSCCPTGNGWRCQNGRCKLRVKAGAQSQAGIGPMDPVPTDWSVATPIPGGDA